jgi:hypothetical protein
MSLNRAELMIARSKFSHNVGVFGAAYSFVSKQRSPANSGRKEWQDPPQKLNAGVEEGWQDAAEGSSPSCFRSNPTATSLLL